MGEQVSDFDRRWLKRYGRSCLAAEIWLLCFHHAGGSAAIFRRWPQLISPAVEPIAVQLPGRADRFNEPAFEHMASLVDALADVVTPLLDRPFAFYGAASIILAITSILLAIPVVQTYLQTGLVPRFPTAILSTGLMILAGLSFFAGLILATVTQGRRELKALLYLQQRDIRSN